MSGHTPTIWTQFYLFINFDGNYDDVCRTNFNIVDRNDDAIYHLDLKIRDSKGEDRRFIQGKQVNNVFQSEIRTNVYMQDLMSVNEINVALSPETYDVTINGKLLLPKFPLEAEELQNFKEIKVDLREHDLGNCLQIDLQKSYMLIFICQGEQTTNIQ